MKSESITEDEHLKGLLIRNGYSHIPPYEHQISRLREEFAARGVELECIENKDFRFRIEAGRIASIGDYDFCIFLDKDHYAAEMVDRQIIPMFNSADAIEICDDKMLTYLELAGWGIRMPDTTPGPLYYDPGMPVDVSTVDVLERRYGYPMVLKEAYGSQGKNVHLVRDRDSLISKMSELRGRKYLIQEFVSSSIGEDMRVIVIGGRAVGGIIRRSEGDFRSNAALGGAATPVEVPETSAYIAEQAAVLLGLDYCGVDLLKDAEGKYSIVCEVNSNAFFEAFESATGINVAGLYADYILRTLSDERYAPAYGGMLFLREPS